jgi:hypothetical protein
MPEIIYAPQQRGQLQLQLFADSVPRRPYCTDDLSSGLSIRPAIDALEKKYIQYNGPAIVRWLVFDVDRAFSSYDDDWRIIAPPNLIIRNPVNSHAHVAYGLAAGVCKTDAARQAPLRLLSAINEGFRHALDADAGFAQLICKNPLNAHWQVETQREALYNLHELSEYVDLDAAVKRTRALSKREQTGLGRNCSLFDGLRTWAYKWVGDFKIKTSFDRWHDAVRDKAEKLNIFFDPLPLSEIRATAKSVARWTWKNYDGRLSASSLSTHGLTPETFSLMQSNLGTMAMRARWGDNSDKRAQALAMRAEGHKQAAIAKALDVDQGTVSRWLRVTKR